MNELLITPAGEIEAGDEFEILSERLELESIRYSRALTEEEEAKLI